MFFYKVAHKYKLDNHFECKEIGIFSSVKNAESAIDVLKQQPGFINHQNGFKIRKVFRFIKPKLLDRIFWGEGFETYHY